MWVVKVPKRSDFCGCPPCPLCFVWAEPNKEVIDGITKMARDLLGRKPVTKEETNALVEGAERVHQRNLLKMDPLKIQDEKDQMEFLVQQNTMELARRAKIQERPKVDTRPVCDHIDLEPKKKGKKKEKVEEKVEEKISVERAMLRAMQEQEDRMQYEAARAQAEYMTRVSQSPYQDSMAAQKRYDNDRRRMEERENLKRAEERMKAKMNTMFRYSK